MPSARHSTVEFAEAARAIAAAARAGGWVAPSYRCPPGLVGVDRTIRRRRGDAGAVVSVRVKGRPWGAVVADVIEGVIVTNNLTAPEADRARNVLWQAVSGERMTHRAA